MRGDELRPALGRVELGDRDAAAHAEERERGEEGECVELGQREVEEKVQASRLARGRGRHR